MEWKDAARDIVHAGEWIMSSLSREQLTKLGQQALSDHERGNSPVASVARRAEESNRRYEDAEQQLAAFRDVACKDAQQAVVALVDAFIADGGALLASRLKGADDEAAVNVSDRDAQLFLSYAMRGVEICLQRLWESLAEADPSATCFHCQQAQRLVAVMRELQEAWPWTDAEAIEQSWQQYERGELMDFETFKHELFKAAE